MLKKFYNWTKRELKYPANSQFFKTLCVLGVVISLAVFFTFTDFTPATDKDYTPLYEQQEVILKDFNSVYSFKNSSIEIIEENILITLSNEECKLKICFDRNLNYKYSSLIETYFNFFKAVIFAILFGFLGLSISFWIYIIILLILTIIGSIIEYFINRNKNNE